jgi:uncharacterized protein YkwD
MGVRNRARRWWVNRIAGSIAILGLVGTMAASSSQALSTAAPPTFTAFAQSSGTVRTEWTTTRSFERASKIQISRSRSKDVKWNLALLDGTRLDSMHYVDPAPWPGETFYSARYFISGQFTAWSASVSVTRPWVTTTTTSAAATTTTAAPTPTTTAPSTTTSLPTATTKPSTTTTAAPTTTTQAAPPAPGSGPAPISLPTGLSECPSDATTTMISLVNHDRGTQGLAPINENSQLDWAARKHSVAMATGLGLSHTGWAQEISDSGFVSSNGWLAQNIGYSTASYSPSVIESMFFNETPPNDGHRRNILNTYAHFIGVSCVFQVSNHTYWWTQDFGN